MEKFLSLFHWPQLLSSNGLGYVKTFRDTRYTYNMVSLSPSLPVGMFSSVPTPPENIFKNRTRDRMLNYNRIFQAEAIGDGIGGGGR